MRLCVPASAALFSRGLDDASATPQRERTLRSANATAYRSAQARRATRNPCANATRSTRVEPITEPTPFTANPQSISDPTRRPAFGNGMPMKNPRGAIQIAVTMTPAEQRLLSAVVQVNPAAHEAYLKGRFHRDLFTPQDLETGPPAPQHRERKAKKRKLYA